MRLKLGRYTNELGLVMKLRERNLRKFSRILAAAFLALLVFEFASHGMICSNQHDSEENAVYATDYGHEDPCQTLVMCSQSRQRDQQQPRSAHDTVQHNGLSSIFELDQRLFDLRSDLTHLRSSVGEIFRPPDPPFQPPKRS